MTYRAANSISWPDISNKLALINKPVLLICREKAGERNAMELAANLIKQVELKIIPGLYYAQAYWYGHLVAPLIIDFILGNVKT